jgi:hypothetical protein
MGMITLPYTRLNKKSKFLDSPFANLSRDEVRALAKTSLTEQYDVEVVAGALFICYKTGTASVITLQRS